MELVSENFSLDFKKCPKLYKSKGQYASTELKVSRPYIN